MINDILRPKEKKVEYVELIYDLIFVYIVGRNNLLLHNFENGFIQPAAFLSYIMTTLAVIQIQFGRSREVWIHCLQELPSQSFAAALV